MDLVTIGLAVTGDDYNAVSDIVGANGGLDPALARAQVFGAWVAGTFGREPDQLGRVAGLGLFVSGLQQPYSRDTLAGQIVTWSGVIYENTTRREIARLMTADARAARELLQLRLREVGSPLATLVPPIVNDDLTRVARGKRVTMDRIEPLFNTGVDRIDYDSFLAIVGYNYVCGLLTGMQVVIWADN